MSDHTAALPEISPEPPRRKNRGLLAIVGSVLAVVLIAGGGYAAWQFLAGGGPRPAEVLPDSTFAVVTLDLNPSGGRKKVEAIKTLRKFPSWKERAGLTPDSDVIKAIFDEATKEGPCKSLDYERDVKPWIGNRAAFGGVQLGDKPAPMLALQITDRENAKPGFAELVKCSGANKDDDFGWTVTDNYIIASDSTPHAQAIATAGEKSPLSEAPTSRKWTEEAGGPGILNAYVGPKSLKILSETMGPDFGSLTGGGADTGKDFAQGDEGLQGCSRRSQVC